MIFAYLRAALLDASSDLAPVQTIFPDINIRAVVLGSVSRMMTAANLENLRKFYLLGLYSVFLHLKAMVFKSKTQPKLTVDTIFCNTGQRPFESISNFVS